MEKENEDEQDIFIPNMTRVADVQTLLQDAQRRLAQLAGAQAEVNIYTHLLRDLEAKYA